MALLQMQVQVGHEGKEEQSGGETIPRGAHASITI